MAPGTPTANNYSSAPSTPRQTSASSSTSEELKLREKRKRERERAEAERKELRGRLEKLQSIVLNAKNVDQKRDGNGRDSVDGEEGSGEGPRPVSPVKGFRPGDGDDDDESDVRRFGSWSGPTDEADTVDRIPVESRARRASLEKSNSRTKSPLSPERSRSFAPNYPHVLRSLLPPLQTRYMSGWANWSRRFWS